MKEDVKDYLWVERFRPQIIEDCILPDRIKKMAEQLVKDGEITNLLLTGTGGTGKTTLAKAICNELQCDYMVINGSDSAQSGIDQLRTTIRQFASTTSIMASGKRKNIILDESDGLSATTQAALRAFIEEFHSNCRFILTANFKNKIIDPIQSRLVNIDFQFTREEQMAMKAQMFKRVMQILDKEGVKVSQPKILAEYINSTYPDNRKILNGLQLYTKYSKEIDTGLLASTGQGRFDDMVKYLRNKNFRELRKWVSENADIKSESIFRHIYDNVYSLVEPQSIPSLILIIGDGQYKSSMVVDQEINLMATMVQIMSDCVFKEG